MKPFREIRIIGLIWLIQGIWEAGRRLIGQNNIDYLMQQSDLSAATIRDSLQLELYFFLAVFLVSIVAIVLMWKGRSVGFLLGCLVTVAYLVPVLILVAARLPIGLFGITGIVLNGAILVTLIRLILRRGRSGSVVAAQ